MGVFDFEGDGALGEDIANSVEGRRDIFGFVGSEDGVTDDDGFFESFVGSGEGDEGRGCRFSLKSGGGHRRGRGHSDLSRPRDGF